MEAPPGGKVNQEFFLMGKEEAVSAIERWLAQAFELRSGSILPRREVYDAYLAWCGDHNVEATAQSAFGKILHRVFPSLQSRRMGGKGRHVMCYQDFARKTATSTVPPSPAASSSSSTTSLRATTSNSADTMPTAAPLGTLRPNRASSPASLGARSNREQPSGRSPTVGLASPPQPLSLAETLSRSAPTPLVRKPGQGPGGSSLPHTGSRPSSPGTDSSGNTQQGEQPDDRSPYRWLHSTVASYGSRKRVRSDGPGAQRGRSELGRRTSQRGGSGATAMKEERGGGDDGEEEQQAEMEEEEREEDTDDAGRDVVDGVHLERLHMKGGAGGADVKSEKEDEERVQLQKWLEREIEDDIRLLRQSNVPQRQQHQHQHQQNPSPTLISHLMDHPGMGLGHHLLQDTFGFAAAPGGVSTGGPGLRPSVGELFDMQMMARRHPGAHASQPPPLPPLVPDRPAEGAAWYRSAYSFPMLSFTHASQHPWVVCSFFTSLAFMRQGILGDQVILPLADHFIRLTEYYLEGDLVEAVNQLARARDQISSVFDTTRVEVAWSLLCLTWWNRLLLSDSSGQSRCAYYVALARQMCVQLQLPSGHDVAVSAHLTPLAPAVGLQLGSSLAQAAVVSQSPVPLSPQLTPSPSLGPPSFAAASPLGRPISPRPLVMTSSSSLPPFPQFGATHPSSRTPSPPPQSSVGPSAASLRQPEDIINRISRELYACKTMKEHIDSALPYCKIENDLLQCFIIAFDLVLLHMRGPSASLGSAAVSLTTHLLFLPPSVLSICIFELGLKERILETVLGLLPQYVDGSQVEALYHNLGAMHSLIPVARAMELMRLSVTRSTSN